MKNLENNLNELLQIEGPTGKEVSVQEVEVEILEATVKPKEGPTRDSVEDDFEKSRKTIRNMIEQGERAVEGIMEVAEESEHPRAYEVAGSLIKNVTEAAKSLLELQKQLKEIKKDSSEEPQKQQQQGSINVDRAVFVGAPHELLAKIKGYDSGGLS